jgi:hypothetical protein
VKATQVFIDRLLDTQNAGTYLNGILVSLKKNEILIQATSWMNLEDIVINEISQVQNIKYYVIQLYKEPGIVTFIEVESRMAISRV